VLIRSIDVVEALESSQVEGDQDLGLRVGGGSIQACGSETTPEKKSREIKVQLQDWPVILQEFCAAPSTLLNIPKPSMARPRSHQVKLD
jgi:hypothetical protein